MAHRSSKVKVQSLSSDFSAFNQLYAAAGLTIPFTRPERGLRTSLGSTRLGLARILGEEEVATARLTMRVVLACRGYCLERARSAKSKKNKLYWLYTALYIVVNTRWCSCGPTSCRSARSTGCGVAASPTSEPVSWGLSAGTSVSRSDTRRTLLVAGAPLVRLLKPLVEARSLTPMVAVPMS
jgi:hypothetical protein